MDLSHLSVHSVASHGQTRTAWTAQVCPCWAGVGAGPGWLLQPSDPEKRQANCTPSVRPAGPKKALGDVQRNHVKVSGRPERLQGGLSTLPAVLPCLLPLLISTGGCHPQVGAPGLKNGCIASI